MSHNRLATRYAKSLLGLAIERNELDQAYSDMKWLQAICKSNRDFVNMLRSPVIKSDAKGKIIIAVAKDNIGKLVNTFIHLLVSKGREGSLPEIAYAFIEQYKTHKEIYSIKLTTASPVNEETKQMLIELLRKLTNMRNIELETVVNEDIIGGFILQTNERLADASIAYDLKEISRQFENNDFIFKIR